MIKNKNRIPPGAAAVENTSVLLYPNVMQASNEEPMIRFYPMAKTWVQFHCELYLILLSSGLTGFPKRFAQFGGEGRQPREFSE